MKFVKYLFTVPEGEKVTDRHFRRVLISSVCSILLSMTCLVGTTWAWYTASIQTPAITLQVAYHNVQLVDENNAPLQNPLTVEAGTTYKVTAKFSTDAKPDTMNTEPCRILRLEILPKGSTDVKVLFVQPVEKDGIWQAQLELTTDEACEVNIYSQWEQPKSEPIEAGLSEPCKIKLIEVDETESGDNAEGEKTEEDDSTVTPTPDEGDDSTVTPDPEDGENADDKTGTGEGENTTPDDNATPEGDTNSDDNTNP